MKTHFLFLFLLVIACNKEQNLTPEHIINSSIKKHDPNNNFENLDFKIRVQEPRLQNFVRFSNVSLNNKTGAFILERNRKRYATPWSLNYFKSCNCKYENLC